jgi:hypothetical protein
MVSVNRATAAKSELTQSHPNSIDEPTTGGANASIAFTLAVQDNPDTPVSISWQRYQQDTTFVNLGRKS